MNAFSTRPTRPLYQQIGDALAERIAAGEWKPNTAIPNETDLARELGVSPGTMRKALDLLEVDGLLTRRQGRGTFVNDVSSPQLAARYNNFYADNGERIVGEINVLDTTEGAPNEIECARLCLSEGDLVVRIRRVRSHLAKPYLSEETSLPAALFPRLRERGLGSHSVVAIAHAYGVLLGHAVENISLGVASQPAAAVLGVAEGSPVFMLDRVIASRAGRPAEWRRAQCPMNAMHYRVEVHKA